MRLTWRVQFDVSIYESDYTEYYWFATTVRETRRGGRSLCELSLSGFFKNDLEGVNLAFQGFTSAYRKKLVSVVKVILIQEPSSGVKDNLTASSILASKNPHT